MEDTALCIADLHVAVDTRGGSLPLVRGASLSVKRGGRTGLVGESGSGKSVTALSVMRLAAPQVRITHGSVRVGATELVGITEEEMRAIRGARIAMVYQDPLSSLNPVKNVAAQVTEAISVHSSLPRRVVRERAVELLEAVGLPDPRRQMDAYPHELSGGMRQRVVIAMAIAMEPDVLIADEPTTALDVTTQAHILKLLARLSDELHLAVLLITHDLAVAADFCDEINVMYAGRIVEQASVNEIFTEPRHPYTRALLNSTVTLDIDLERPMPAIQGQPPLAGRIPAGCPFHPRCAEAMEICASAYPPTVEAGANHMVECVLYASVGSQVDR